MPKQKSELDVLRSIAKQLDNLTTEELARVMAYLANRYRTQLEAQGK